MQENQELPDGQGHDQDKSVQEDINENIRKEDPQSMSNRNLGQLGKESTGQSENEKGNWSGTDDKLDSSAQGSVMPDVDTDDENQPETKVPPSFIGRDSKTGIPQNEVNPSGVLPKSSYHGNPINDDIEINEKQKLNAENVGGTSEED